jgi:excisionase family DNA binding protein
MLSPPDTPLESYRRAELRLRMLLFGDESDTPGVIRGGEEARLRVQAELRRMRHAVGDLASAHDEEEVGLGEELHRVAAARAEEAESALLRPAEAALALGVSVSSIYRAVRIGDMRAVQPAGTKRGGMRIPAGEIHRLVREPTP